MEPSETFEEDDFMLPAKKKKSRKVKDFQEDIDILGKEDGRFLIVQCFSTIRPESVN